ncbi:hypothetical protein TcasGA2_TC013637 [Tribolium castaneum]|uniref:Uncharacterized protein n=1 Tax=Tribolium castaneum TaxID=7070 RepID=D6W6U9_TRICA|nr:hypothetical protein TcasGA2_TC013637 [Tribolium castaneum]
MGIRGKLNIWLSVAAIAPTSDPEAWSRNFERMICRSDINIVMIGRKRRIPLKTELSLKITLRQDAKCSGPEVTFYTLLLVQRVDKAAASAITIVEKPRSTPLPLPPPPASNRPRSRRHQTTFLMLLPNVQLPEPRRADQHY